MNTVPPATMAAFTCMLTIGRGLIQPMPTSAESRTADTCRARRQLSACRRRSSPNSRIDATGMQWQRQRHAYHLVGLRRPVRGGGRVCSRVWSRRRQPRPSRQLFGHHSVLDAHLSRAPASCSGTYFWPLACAVLVVTVCARHRAAEPAAESLHGVPRNTRNSCSVLLQWTKFFIRILCSSVINGANHLLLFP